MAMQPPMMPMQMQVPMQGDMQSMQAYAQQAQEMANQYARQAQAFAQQAAEAAQAQAQIQQEQQQPYQEQQPPYQEQQPPYQEQQQQAPPYQEQQPPYQEQQQHQPYQEQAYQEPYFQPYNDGMQQAMPQQMQQPEVGFMPYNDHNVMMDHMMDQFGAIALTPTRNGYNGGMPSPFQPQYTMTMPGAAEAAVTYAVTYSETPSRRRRNGGVSSPRKPCDFFSRNGECRNGANCKFEHALLPESVEAFPPMPTSTPPSMQMPGASNIAVSKVAETEQKSIR